MKRSTKQLLSMLLAIVMVFGLMAPAMAARPMGGEVAETPAGQVTPKATRTSVKQAALMATTGAATTYKLDFDDPELAAVDVNGSYAAGKYGTGDFFTFSDDSIAKKNVGTGDDAVSGLNLTKSGGNYIGFAITGTDATVKVTFRGASGGATPKTSGGGVYKYDGDTKGDALVDPTNPTNEIVGNTVVVTATYTNVPVGSYRVVETAGNTTVHVLSIEVTETDGNVYTDCNHANPAPDDSTAKPASCTAPGKEADTICPNCGKITATGAPIAALDHDYKDGVCTRCGDKEVAVLTGGSWKASLADLPGGVPEGAAADAKDVTSANKITAETKVNTGDITAVELYIPAVDDNCRWKEESGAEGYEGWISFKSVNGGATAGEKTGDATPTGTYFLFKVKQDGVLNIYSKVNSEKKYYCVDKDNKAATPNSGSLDETNTRAPLKDTIQVKAGDEVKVWCNGSKPMLYGFDFSSGALEKGTADWTAEAQGADKATITGTADNTKGTIAVKVVGPKVGVIVDAAEGTMTTYADSMSVEMLDATGKVVATKTSKDAGATHSFTFKPLASGKYTFKASLKRDGETDIPAGTGESDNFILPFNAPTINSVSSNGKESGKETVSMAVAWSSVPEANNYKLYVKANSDAEWGEAIDVPATDASNVSYNVTGLTAGTKYDFALEAVRNDGTINGVHVTEKTTDKSAIVSGDAVATKQNAWATVSYGNSATVSETAIGPGSQTPQLSITDADGKEVTKAPANGILKGTVTYDFSQVKGSAAVKDTLAIDHKETFEGLTGDLNTDPEGRILLSSRDGAGKIQEPNGSDGLLFHYLTVPAGHDFRLKAKVHVARWYTRATQNGVGLMVADRIGANQVGPPGSTETNKDVFNNVYMAGAVRLAFTYSSDKDKAYGKGNTNVIEGDKGYAYYMGLASLVKHGNDKNYAGSGNAPTTMYDRVPLDTRIPKAGTTVKYANNTNRFNTIGNYTALPAGYSLLAEKTEGATQQVMEKYEMTDFILQIEKTPSGYVSTAWKADGELLGEVVQHYAKGAPELSACKGNTANNPYVHYADAKGAENAVDQSGNAELGLEIMDPSTEYVGLFTSRDMDAVFSDVEFEMWPQSDKKDTVELPTYDEVDPSVKFTSGPNSNTPDFNLAIATNMKGTVEITKNGASVATVTMSDDEKDPTGVFRAEVPVTLTAGTNTYKAKFDPASSEEQGLPPFVIVDPTPELSEVEASTSVTYRTYYNDRTNLYVSPNGSTSGRGSRVSPLDIHTAVTVVAPGQNIVMMEGEYKLSKSIDITPAMDGTEDAPIFLTPDVDEDGNPVKVILNGQGKAGTVIKTGADWWVFDNFEVVNSSPGSRGFTVGGNHNIVQNVSIHDNGSSGLGIGRYSSNGRLPDRTSPSIPADQVTDWGEWPCDNLILNCSSYRNYDVGYENADGFEAKENVGSGNVFDGCVSFWNADDGWDLYAKADADKGCLGVVTLRNCITFQNGYEVRKIKDALTQTPELVEGSTYLPVMDTDADGNIQFHPAGNGNGFKLGGSKMPGAHEIHNSYAFMNAAKGIDSNSGPDIQVYDCTSYNNGDENIGLNTNGVSEDLIKYVVSNVISFKDKDCVKSSDGKIMMSDTIAASKNNSITDYFEWKNPDEGDTKKNIPGKVGGSTSNGTTTYTHEQGLDIFESLTFDPKSWWDGADAYRDADGSLNLGTFLQRKLDNVGAGELINGTTDKPVTSVTIPDSVFNPPPEPVISAGGGGGGGNGGTAGAEPNKPSDGNKPATSKFDDVAANDWFNAAVDFVADKGLMTGTAERIFEPDTKTTRAMIATILWRLDGEKTAKTAMTFTDVPANEWYTKAIAWAAEAGVVKGYNDETFGPLNNVTRAQMVTMLYRYVGTPAVEGVDLSAFVDADQIEDWAADAMSWAVKNGILTGKDGGRLDPAGLASRAEVATILQRYVDLVK